MIGIETGTAPGIMAPGTMALTERVTLDELRAAIRGFLATDVPEGPSEKAHELEHLRKDLDLLELRFSRTAGAFALTRYWEDEGFISPYQWVRLNCKMGGGAAGQRITVGLKADSLPAAVEALESGEIGFAHLSLIASTSRALDESPNSPVFDERGLLEKARDLNVREFAKACVQARYVADPSGYELTQREQTERQTLHLRQCEDGMWLLNALLDNDNGTALDCVIAALSKKTGIGDDRPLHLRRAWALGELARHGLDTIKLPAVNRQVPHLQLTASLPTLLGAIGAPGAELEGGQPINIQALRRIACDCATSRVILSGDSAVLEVGDWVRCVSAPLRRAVVHRDRHCQWPGCDRPASWTDTHHVVFWTDGGRTVKENLVLLCYRHHYMVHEGHWTLTLKNNREVVVVPPDYTRRIQAA